MVLLIIGNNLHRISPRTYYTWYYLYYNPGALLRLNFPPLINDNIVYFPSLGNTVEAHCDDACRIAQEKLNAIGYFHTDLYSDGHYNCSNVREFNGDFYPIDVFKIIELTHNGGKRRSKYTHKTNRRKTNRHKKTHRKTKKKN